MLAVLEASSPESVRDRVKSFIRSITVVADGRVVVDGTYEPLVLAEIPVLADAAEIVRTMWVPGGRTHNGENPPIRHRQAMECDRRGLVCRGSELNSPLSANTHSHRS